MSTPTSRDPLSVTTADGAVWTRQALTMGGRGLYGLQGDCPPFVLATLDDLAVHGVTARSDDLAAAVALLGALPMPAGDGEISASVGSLLGRLGDEGVEEELLTRIMTGDEVDSDESLSPQLREALDRMARRGPVIELTGQEKDTRGMPRMGESTPVTRILPASKVAAFLAGARNGRAMTGGQR